MTAPPCRISGRVQSSGLTTISAFTPVSLAATNFRPSTLAKGSWWSFRNWVLSMINLLVALGSAGGVEPAQAEILQNGEIGHDQRDHCDARNARRRPRRRQEQDH